jgi:alkylation response protein AidB-like acyl-CoA dehydrogenase
MFNPEPHPRRQELVALAEDLAANRFASRAAHYDSTATFPCENFRDLHDAGLMALTIPSSLGGLDVDPVTYVETIKAIARADGSTGLMLHMHSTISGIVGALGNDRQKERYLGEVVRDGTLIASFASEPTSSFRGALHLGATAERVPGGFQVSGLKHFCSMSTAAGYYVLWLALPGAASLAEGLVNLVVPSNTPGIEVIPVWDAIGMRATETHNIRLTDVFVPDRDMLGSPGEILKRELPDRFSLGYCAVYLGVAEAAYDFIVEYARTKTFLPDPRPIAESPMVQQQIGQMNVEIQAGNLFLHHAAEAVASGSGTLRTTALNQAKYVCGEAALRVTETAMKVCGGRALLRAYPLERYIRDTRAAPLMPPSSERCLESVGKLAFGMETSTIGFQPQAEQATRAPVPPT